MPWHARGHRHTIALFAWLAWVAVAVVISALPFFFELRLWTPSGSAYWGCKHGSVYRASVGRSSVNDVRGEDLWLVEWNPGTAASLDFEWGPSRNVEPKPTSYSRPFVRRAPPWAVLLLPTLLVILLARPARWFARQLPTWVARVRDWQSAERRALLAAGRVPCPNCDYDVTGLERCPECGTLARAVRTSPLRPLRPARLALILWLGLTGAAALMPFLVFADIEIDRVSMGTVAGTAYFLYDTYASTFGSSRSTTVLWHPSLLHIFTFDAGWTANYRYVQFPPWLVLLVPTLVAMAVRRELRYSKHHKIKKLGRPLCSACQYDATGLEVCPECGAAIKPEPAGASDLTRSPRRRWPRTRGSRRA